MDYLADVIEKEVRPVTGLAASGDELVRVEDHNLVLVGLVHQYAVNSWSVRHHHRKPIAHQSEYAFHSSWCCWSRIYTIRIDIALTSATRIRMGILAMRKLASPWGTSLGRGACGDFEGREAYFRNWGNPADWLSCVGLVGRPVKSVDPDHHFFFSRSTLLIFRLHL